MTEEEIQEAMQRRIRREWIYTLAPFVALIGLLIFVWISE